jgi:hypothetical protein
MSKLACLWCSLLIAASATAAKPDASAQNGPPEECGKAAEGAYADGYLTLKLDESFCLGIEYQGEELVLTPVSKPKSKSDVLAFHFSHAESGALLTVSNGSARAIKYSAEMQPGHEVKWYPTSICPVQANLVSFESWPHPVRVIRLSGFYAVKEGTQLTCD